jgi:hypothetical protein
VGWLLAPIASADGFSEGRKIYEKLCQHCHGDQGQGVAGQHDEPLYGTRSVEWLARYIHRAMPEEDPTRCVDEEAQAVAAYIHESFYSPEARARARPPRIELARLTNRQYRESVADLVGSFSQSAPATRPGGLRAEYFQSDGMNKKAKRVFAREDVQVAFDFGTNSPGPGITADQFSIAWQGALMAPDTGLYELRLRTPNGARLYVNADLRAGDANLRDDSDARRHHALIDLWVSSGGQMREETVRLFLLGGRSYPLRLDFFKYMEPHASLFLEWKPPHGVWSVLRGEHLSPETSPVVTVVTTAFPPDDGSHGYERGIAVSKAWHEATTQAAAETASQVIARLGAISGVRDNVSNRAERLREFAASFAERAFRRPLTAELRESYVDRQFAGTVAPEVAIRRVVLAVLTSPRFLYPELGEAVDDYTVASRLALGLWDSLPDAALREAARQGNLRAPAQVRAQAQRMGRDPRARAKLRGFFEHWLAAEEAEDISKDPEVFPDFDEAVLADKRASLEHFVEHVVWSEASDYRELLLADYLFLNARLARFLGVEPPPGDGFHRVRFDPAQRAGVFTQPYLLTSLAYYRSTSPIHRGVWLSRNVLGRFLRPPPMAIEFMDDRFDPSLTMREKVTELTKADNCMACHVTINPLGFSLEHYDAVGRYRSSDNGKPVNAQAEYLTSAGDVVRLRGPRDLAEHAATSEEARRGFVRQMFLHTIKQPPAAYGSNTLEELDAAFTNAHYHVRNLFTETVARTALHGLGTPQTASR